ncbi:MAG: hypothetical protein E7660_07680 [Ruminococcaceae bacterium]|nr:hypothetical protein [Oscillospiraceae bacterium]
MKLRKLFDRYGYFLYTLFVPVYLILFFVTEGIVTADSSYLVSYLPVIDDAIPFCEWFAVPYVSWYLYMFGIGVFLLCREPDGARRYLLNIGLSFNFFIVVSLLVPNGQDLRVDLSALGRDNFCIDIMRWIYSADTNTNVCPSIHAVGTMCVMAATLHSKEIKSKAFKVLYSLWGVFIIIATVFLKQHSVIDVFVAVPYFFIFYFIVYRLIKFKKHYEPVLKCSKGRDFS